MAFTQRTSLFYRRLTQLAANSKLAASLVHILLCGYDRLISRGRGDRLYSVWYPASALESSKQFYEGGVVG